MFEMLATWYKKRFSDPDAVSLFAIILVVFFTIYFIGHLIVPLLVAIVLAYLLEWPVNQLTKLGASRSLSVMIVILFFIGVMIMAVFGLIPTIWKQIGNLWSDIPTMYGDLQKSIASFPQKYPALADFKIIESLITNVKNQLVTVGESAVKGSVASLMSIVSLAIYMVLVPLMVFFLLKDKNELVLFIKKLLPQNRVLVNKVGVEMNQQISNYIRGKVLEIIIVGIASYLAFVVLDLRYAVLLAVAVGLSVLIPYIGAAVVTVPVAIVALFQWGISPEFYWLMIIYGIIQAIDGNVIVPILFSEAVNLHPVIIIVAVLFFGGLWGFWGVFFAIPLATLVKAVWNAVQSTEEAEEPPKIAP